MAKYFSTPSKSFHSQFDEDQKGHLRDEKSCMERLLTEVSPTLPSRLPVRNFNPTRAIPRALRAPHAVIAPRVLMPPTFSLPTFSVLVILLLSPKASKIPPPPQRPSSISPMQQRCRLKSLCYLLMNKTNSGPDLKEFAVKWNKWILRSKHLVLNCASKDWRGGATDRRKLI